MTDSEPSGEGPDRPGAAFPAAPGRSTMPAWYLDLLESVASRVEFGRGRAVAAVNRELITTYWGIGRDILDRQDQEGWGASIIDRLSADLQSRFPEARGCSPRNLRYMRSFAAAWPDPAILQEPLAELPWYHQIALIQKLPDPDSRRWYAAADLENGWSHAVLVHHIETGFRERSGKAITNFTATLPPADSDQAQQATRDPYLFDFLGNAQIRRERDLERGLIDHVGAFLLELGQGFALVGRQVRLELGGDEFYCDLLFYHLKLRRYVVIELKAVAFEPGFLGQLGMYLAAVDDLLAQEGDKPTIGLLLCRTKNNVVAEYALRGHSAPIGVSEWATEITQSLPAELVSSLPSIEELEAELADPGGDPT